MVRQLVRHLRAVEEERKLCPTDGVPRLVRLRQRRIFPSPATATGRPRPLRAAGEVVCGDGVAAGGKKLTSADGADV